MIKVEGKANISATVVCDSISPEGKRLTTMEIEVPRIVWAEFMTHRMFSRNAASSRAIPFEKMCEQLKGRPVRFGAANKGMQDKGEEHEVLAKVWNEGAQEYDFVSPQVAWGLAKAKAQEFAESFYEANYHKQVYNRLTEPFQMIKGIVSATEWNNFFWLRDDDAADPTIRELAVCMRRAMEQSEPKYLQAGHWHLPFVFAGEDYLENPIQAYMIKEGDGTIRVLTLEQAIKVSAARCAAVSFRNEDYGLEKCLQVYARLVGDERVHASALEHQATPMEDRMYTEDVYDDVNVAFEPCTWQEGITHADKSGALWSANYHGWIQYRQTIPNNVKKG